MVFKLLIAGILLGTLSLGVGCKTVKSTFGMGPTGIMSYHSGAEPVEAKTDQEGTYTLYARGDKTPRVTVNLRPGERLGFGKSQDGQVYAVAGDQKFPLPSNNDYVWQRERK